MSEYMYRTGKVPVKAQKAYLLLIPYYCADCKVVALLQNCLSLLLCVQVSLRLQS